MSSDKKFVVYTLRIPKEEFDPIEELAKEFNKSKIDVIRDALKLYALIKTMQKEGWQIFVKKGDEVKELILTW